MSDSFDDALTDLKDALTNGENVDAAIRSAAGDHDLKPEALRNRATKRWGDLSGFGAANREREIEAAARDKEADLIERARRASAKPLDKQTDQDRAVINKALSINRFWRSI